VAEFFKASDDLDPQHGLTLLLGIVVEQHDAVPSVTHRVDAQGQSDGFRVSCGAEIQRCHVNLDA